MREVSKTGDDSILYWRTGHQADQPARVQCKPINTINHAIYSLFITIILLFCILQFGTRRKLVHIREPKTNYELTTTTTIRLPKSTGNK